MLSIYLLLVTPASAVTVIVGYVLYQFTHNYMREYTSPIAALPGPKRESWLHGNFRGNHEPNAQRLVQSWFEQYGHAFRYFAFFGTQKLNVLDTKAIQHVLHRDSIYQKSDQVKHLVGSLFGQGLLFVEGKDHKRQRKIINPAFGSAQVSRFTETFVSKSLELRDVWTALASKSTRKDGRVRIDAFAWLNRVTLDIIGLAGFGYDFDALHTDDSHPNELYEAMNRAMSSPRSKLMFLMSMIPAFRNVPTPASRERQRNLDVIIRVGSRLIEEKKAGVLAAAADGRVEKDDIGGSDLLSLLIRANMAADVPDNMRMSDSEIISQVPTFLIAGHETTSTLLTWTIFVLSTSFNVQSRLRAELRAHPTSTPTLDELNSLPYLDAVLREVLRLYAPVSATQRVAMDDDIIPLAEPVLDKHGRPMHEIRVAKGDTVTIPIRILNRTAAIWGEDAEEFRPERFLGALPASTGAMPGVFPPLLSFLAGAHACIGFRFSVAEAKALLFTMVREFEFELAITPDEIVRKTALVGRPSIDTMPGRHGELPVLIRPVKD